MCFPILHTSICPAMAWGKWDEKHVNLDWGNSAPPRHRQRTNQKRPVLGVTSLVVPQALKYYRLLPMLSVTLQNLMVWSYCWRHRTRKKQAGSDSSSSLLPSFQRHLKIEKLMYGFLGLRKTDFCEQTFLIKWWWEQLTPVRIQLNNTHGTAPPGVMPLRGCYVAFQGSL